MRQELEEYEWNKRFGGSGHDNANFGELTSDGGYNQEEEKVNKEENIWMKD